MPFQPINFANIEPQGNPVMRNLASNLMQGYQMGQMPAQMNRQREKEEMGNALSKLQLEQEPEKFKAEMTRNKLLNALTSMQMQGQEMELNPNKKVAHMQAFVQALKNSGMNVTPEMVTGLMRRTMGLEEQSPQEKLQNAIMQYRATHAAGTQDDITTANKTKNLGVIQAVEDTLPVVEQLEKLDTPGQFLGKYFSPNDQATYNATTGSIIDSLMSAYNYPKTNESIKIAQHMVERDPRETQEHYLGRLKSLKEDLNRRRSRALSSIGSSPKKGAGTTFNLATGEFE